MSQKTRLWRGIQTFEERLEKWEKTSFEALDIESMEAEIVRYVFRSYEWDGVECARKTFFSEYAEYAVLFICFACFVLILEHIQKKGS